MTYVLNSASGSEPYKQRNLNKMLYVPIPDRWLKLLITIVMLPILLTVYSASQARLVSDDYQYAMIADERGVWEATRYWYDTWTGNYSSSFLQSLAWEPLAISILMPLIVIALALGTIWLSIEIAFYLNWPQPKLLGTIAACLMMVGVIDGLPNIYDTLYWAAGGIAHVVPLVGVICFSAFTLAFLRHPRSSPTIFIVSVLSIPYTLIIGGFSSPSTAHMIVLCSLGIVALIRLGDHTQRQAGLPVLMMVLISSVVAILLISAAPGTDERQMHFPPPPDLINFIRLTATYTLIAILLELTFIAPLSIVLVSVSMGWIGYFCYAGDRDKLRQALPWLLTLLWLTGLLLVAAGFSTGAYAMSASLPARAFTTPAYTLIMVAAASGYIIGSVYKRSDTIPLTTHLPRWVYISTVAVFVLSLGISVFSGIRQSVRMHTFSEDWRLIDSILRQAQAHQLDRVMVPPLRFDLGAAALEHSLDDDPTTGTNRDLALYYGVDEVLLIQPTNQ